MTAFKVKKLHAFETLQEASDWVLAQGEEQCARVYQRHQVGGQLWEAWRYPIFEAEIKLASDSQSGKAKCVVSKVKQVFVGRMTGSFEVAAYTIPMKRKFFFGKLCVGQLGRSLLQKNLMGSFANTCQKLDQVIEGIVTATLIFRRGQPLPGHSNKLQSLPRNVFLKVLEHLKADLRQRASQLESRTE